jgi:type IV pilus assembly protein PilW
MNHRMDRLASRCAQHGFGLIEVMVGLVIGLIAVLVIYQVYTVAEGFKRNTTAAGEAQMNGLFSAFVLGMEGGNGGAAIALAAPDLASCADPTTYPVSDVRHFAESFRPIVSYSMATTLSSTAMFNANAAAGDFTYQIQSTGGFHKGDLIIGIQNPVGNGTPCASSKVTLDPSAVTVPPTCDPADPNKIGNCVATVTLTHTGTNIPYTGTGLVGSATLFNMGPADRAQKIAYRLCDGRVNCPQPPNCAPTTPCTLDSVALLDSSGQPLASPTGNPVASNIINMKVEYGIDNDLDQLGLLDTWVQATAGAGWDPAAMLPATLAKINQVKAIRIGLIVQSEQFDKTLGDYNWVLFDCADAVKANCPGRLSGTIAAQTTPPGNWRFRKYESVIPLRNEIWNKAS